MITEVHNYDIGLKGTTMATSCVCDRYLEFDSTEDIPAILMCTRQDGLRIIGAGSNQLFTRDSYDGTVARSRIRGIEIINDEASDGSVTIRVGAGETMDTVIDRMCREGLWGLENLSGIPGDAGASAVQNVGAYGVEAGDLITEVEAYDKKEKEWVVIPSEKCAYSYRDSIFKHPEGKDRYVIHHVRFRLSRDPKPVIGYPALGKLFGDHMPTTPEEVRKAVISIRDSKLPDPAKVPSAGSFFKNPVIDENSRLQLLEHCKKEGIDPPTIYPAKSPEGEEGWWKVPAAWLIDRCGWKGYTDGRAGVWHLQPLVLVNYSRNASGEDIVKLENRIRASVVEKFGIRLTPEVEHI